MSDMGTEMHCSDCDSIQQFVTPPCEDSHGLDCPDLACVTCGLAMTGVGLLISADIVLVAAA